MLLRGLGDTDAVVLPPVIIQGIENQENWRTALNTIPKRESERIRAVVSDGHVGIINFAKGHFWIIQRCHFHLLSAIQHRRSRRHTARFPAEGMEIWTQVKIVLETYSQEETTSALKKISLMSLTTTSRELRSILRGFVKNYRHFRSYINYPNLNLPITSNTAESFIGRISELLHRLRGLSSCSSLEKWIEALTKYKKQIKCNGFNQPN